MTPIGAMNTGDGRVSPEQLDRQIALLGAREHSRHQAPAFESGDVDTLGAFVARAAGDV